MALRVPSPLGERAQGPVGHAPLRGQGEGAAFMKKHPVLFAFLILAGLFFLFITTIVVAVIFGGSWGARQEPVAVVKVEGPILDALETVKKLEELRKDKNVKAVVLRLESPGGSVAASQEIFEQVLLLKQEKKVVASMGTVAASGAYYIACAADRIVANAGSITGSIGVIMETFGLKELMDLIRVKPRTLKSGRYKDVGSPFRDLTPEDREYLQSLLDNMYAQFLKAVADTRGQSLDSVRSLAEGKIYTGMQAKELGLIDELGNIYRAVAVARELAGLPPDAGVRWPKKPSLFERFFEGDKAATLLHTLVKELGSISLPLWMFRGVSAPEVR